VRAVTIAAAVSLLWLVAVAVAPQARAFSVGLQSVKETGDPEAIGVPEEPTWVFVRLRRAVGAWSYTV
jgi:hypothetical protein